MKLSICSLKKERNTILLIFLISIVYEIQQVYGILNKKNLKFNKITNTNHHKYKQIRTIDNILSTNTIHKNLFNSKLNKLSLDTIINNQDDNNNCKKGLFKYNNECYELCPKNTIPDLHKKKCFPLLSKSRSINSLIRLLIYTFLYKMHIIIFIRY